MGSFISLQKRFGITLDEEGKRDVRHQVASDALQAGTFSLDNHKDAPLLGVSIVIYIQ